MVQIEKATEIEELINDPKFDINDWYGYIYLTQDTTTGRKYIGKKNFFHSQNKKLGKKELAAIPVTRGKRPSKKLIIKESDWKTYYGSANEIKSSPKDKYKRYLLKLCKSSKELTYFELKYQFVYGVLEDDTWINDNIQGRFFKKDLI
jgi:hypothetical protein